MVGQCALSLALSQCFSLLYSHHSPHYSSSFLRYFFTGTGNESPVMLAVKEGQRDTAELLISLVRIFFFLCFYVLFFTV